MSKVVTGLIGVVMVTVFLGYYAVSLNALPLWIIIGAILVMVCVEFVQSFRNGNRTPDQT